MHSNEQGETRQIEGNEHIAFKNNPELKKDEVVESMEIVLNAQQKQLYDRQELIKQAHERIVMESKSNQSDPELKEAMLENKEMSEHNEQEIEKINQLIGLLKEGGLTRESLTSRQWHKTFPEAAWSLFGFKSWMETCLYVHALFGLHPTDDANPPADTVTLFEWCLFAKMQMQCALTNRMIALIVGLENYAHVESEIKEWVLKWGEAGQDLDVPRDFLATCPEAYKGYGFVKWW